MSKSINSGPFTRKKKHLDCLYASLVYFHEIHQKTTQLEIGADKISVIIVHVQIGLPFSSTTLHNRVIKFLRFVIKRNLHQTKIRIQRATKNNQHTFSATNLPRSNKANNRTTPNTQAEENFNFHQSRLIKILHRTTY